MFKIQLRIITKISYEIDQNKSKAYIVLLKNSGTSLMVMIIYDEMFAIRVSIIKFDRYCIKRLKKKS